jgi:membrane protease YdiL (CAAX protease family)
MQVSRPRGPVAAGLRIIIVGALFGVATAIFYNPHHFNIPRLPAGDYYSGPRQQIWQADFIYRLTVLIGHWDETNSSVAGRQLHRHLQERAVADYERLALTLSPNPLALHRLGIIYGERGYAPQAEQVLVRAAARDEAQAGLYFALANLYGPQNLPLRYTEKTFRQLADQPQWLADQTLARYLQLTGRAQAASELREKTRHRNLIFGWQLAGLLSLYGLAGLVGLVIIVRAGVRYMFRLPETAPRPVAGGLRVPWDPLTALEAGGVMYFTLAMLSVGMQMLWQYPALAAAPGWLRVGMLTGQYLILAAVTLVFIWGRSVAAQPHRLQALGLAGKGQAGALAGKGLAAYGVLICLLIITGLALQGGHTTGAAAPALSGESLIASLDDPLALGGLFVLICVLAPLVEETIFRGFIFAGLRQQLTLAPAVVTSAALFALLHANPEAMLPIGLIGVVLAVLYEQTRSLWPGIICHALNNTLVFLFMLLMR